MLADHGLSMLGSFDDHHKDSPFDLKPTIITCAAPQSLAIGVPHAAGSGSYPFAAQTTVTVDLAKLSTRSALHRDVALKRFARTYRLNADPSFSPPSSNGVAAYYLGSSALRFWCERVLESC